MNQVSNPWERRGESIADREKRKKREQAEEMLEHELEGVFSEQEVGKLTLKQKFQLLRRLNQPNEDLNFETFSSLVEKLGLGSKEDDQDLMRKFRLHLLNKIPKETMLSFLKAPRRAAVLAKYPDFKKNVDFWEEAEDVDLTEIPDEIVHAYFQAGGTKRFYGIHTTNFPIDAGDIIQPGNMPEVMKKGPDIPETGWTWYAIGSDIYAKNGVQPKMLGLVEGFYSDLEGKSTWVDLEKGFVGTRRKLKVVGSIDLSAVSPRDLGLYLQA